MTEPANYAALRPKPLNWTWLRRALPPDTGMVDLGAYTRIETDADPLCAIVTVDLYGEAVDGAGAWLHMSCSRARRMPTWDDLVLAREELGFGERIFVQLLPPVKYWLNIHNYCLHVFHRLDAETVPRMLWDQEGATGEFYRKKAPLSGG